MPKFRTTAFAKSEAPLPEVVEQTTTARPARTNKYASKCSRCGNQVAAQEGSLDRDGEKWVVSHFPACPERDLTQEVAQNAVDRRPAEFRQTVVDGTVLFDGTYTLETGSGHRTFRLRTQAADDDFMPGVQLIQYLSGSDNESDYTGFGHIKGDRLSVWRRHRDNEALVADAERFMADPHGEGVVRSVKCYRCHRTLTVPASVYNGLGPECARRA